MAIRLRAYSLRNTTFGPSKRHAVRSTLTGVPKCIKKDNWNRSVRWSYLLGLAQRKEIGSIYGMDINLSIRPLIDPSWKYFPFTWQGWLTSLVVGHRESVYKCRYMRQDRWAVWPWKQRSPLVLSVFAYPKRRETEMGVWTWTPVLPDEHAPCTTH